MRNTNTNASIVYFNLNLPLNFLLFCNSQCLNGTTHCYENYIPDENGTLNETQLRLFQDEILRIFYIQYNHDNGALLVDLRHIYKFSFAASGNTS